MGKVAMRALGLAGAALALSGCGVLGTSDAGGSAARSAVGAVGQEELIAAIQAFQGEVGLPANQPAPTLARATLQRLIQDMLIQVQADQMGVTVTQGQIDQGVAQLTAQQGGAAGLAQAAHASGLAVTQVPDLVRSNLLVAGIAEKLATDGDNSAGVMAVQQAITSLSQQSDVRVAPRYGVWDSATLSISTTSTVTQPEPPARMAPLPEVSPSAPEDAASPAASPNK